MKTIRVIAKITTDVFGNFRFLKSVCADAETAKSWIRQIGKAYDFDCISAFGALCENQIRFFILENGTFKRIPNAEVLNIVEN